jgi:pSer/pThr/pTyr-binding forkhead associated (FHA) protein
MNSLMLVLRVLEGPDQNAEFVLTGDRKHVIGRGGGTIPITDNQISRSHATLDYTNGSWLITDLRSTNGTFINNIRITQPTQLRNGDLIRIASNTFQVSFKRVESQQEDPVTVPIPPIESDFASDPESTMPSANLYGETDLTAELSSAAVTLSEMASEQPPRPPESNIAYPGSNDIRPLSNAGIPEALRPQTPVLRSRENKSMLAANAAPPSAPAYPMGGLAAAPPKQIHWIVWVILALLLIANTALIYQIFRSKQSETDQLLHELVAYARKPTLQGEQLVEAIDTRLNSNIQKNNSSLLDEVRTTLQKQLSEDTGSRLDQILKQVESQPQVDTQDVANQVKEVIQKEAAGNTDLIVKEIVKVLRAETPVEDQTQRLLLQQILSQLQWQHPGANGSVPSPAPAQGDPASTDPTLDPDSGSLEPGTNTAFSPTKTGGAFSAYGRIVFLVDASGSLIDTMPRVLAELENLINQITDQSFFTVIFFQHNSAIEIPPKGLKLGTNDNKSLTAMWFRPESGHIIPSGSSNPVNALQMAMGYAPDMICIFSDRVTGTGPGEIDKNSLLQILKELNKNHYTTINTIQFFAQDPQDTLKTIALEHGGIYRFISESKPAPLPVFDEEPLLPAEQSIDLE